MKNEETIIADENKHMRGPVILEKTLHDKAREKFKQNLHKDDDNLV